MTSTSRNKDEVFEKICRICMETGDLQPIFEYNDKYDNETIDLSHKLKFCCNVEVSINDNMPKYICGLCSDALIVAYDLIMLCKYTDGLLRKNIGVVGEKLSIEFEGVKIKTEYIPLETDEMDYSYDSSEEKKFKEKRHYKTERDDSKNSDEYEKTEDKDVETKLETEEGDDKPVVKKRRRRRKKSSGSRVCEECGRCCRNQSELLRHSLMHKPKIWQQCPKCPYRTTLRHSYNIHMRFTHEGHPLLKCDVCPFQTTRNDYLKIHNMRHTGVRPYSCNLCEYKAVNHSNLKKHMVKHTNDRAFVCDTCGLDFKSPRDLKRHKMRIHEHVKIYYCTICPGRLKYIGDEAYKRHMTKKHSLETEKPNIASMS